MWAFGTLEADGQETVGFGPYGFITPRSSGTNPEVPY
jgi:hypothetical protein